MVLITTTLGSQFGAKTVAYMAYACCTGYCMHYGFCGSDSDLFGLGTTLTGCAVLPLSNQSYHHYWSSHRIDWKLCSQLCFDAEKYNIQITKVHSGSVLTTVLSSSQTKQVTIATTKAIVHAVACATCIGHVGYRFRAKLAAKCCSY